MSFTKHLLFLIENGDHWTQVVFHRKPGDPLYDGRGPFGDPEGRRDDVIRFIASSWSGDDHVTLTMQHLDISKPPYDSATAPGRQITMSKEQFSEVVDALVALKARML